MKGQEAEPGHHVEQKRKKLEQECSKLRSKLQSIQSERRKIRLFSNLEVSKKLIDWYALEQESERDQQLAFDEYQALAVKMNHNRRWLNLAQKWNVTNDCFHIWHRGPCGTINGLRLAIEVTPLPLIEEGDTNLKNQVGVINNSEQQQSNLSSFIGNLGKTASSEIGQSLHQNGNGPVSGVSLENQRIPWIEINSALGLVVLLLSTLERKPHSGIKFKNKLIPQGSTSKIGIRKGDIVTFYNLFSDDSFQIFGKRSFNIALNGLLRCLADASEAIEKTDRTLALPHRIECASGGLFLIGGLSISFGTDAKQWTKAMKYVLTNTKWLVAFIAKHNDR
mmetsp:Transcript_5246/g.7580  ORF Transcript_5246/g.7580 Transcript_5246/m.7580 type:complete len:336 (+) Transcript_5246:90-1097(+)|eukprot:CAMPEP_0194235952 /NCGR_PEP_ID=MMETSP0158-20130606/3318_1 /TAXON_ID=33649 /ORGANISM="Thalassionema nitzschioides, Strain L26-B" /LENGTH=335 /DNA_ID=CAMNT_0038969571 /DNA_START=1 /DNA_END=1008 /DNA_ORIENTATION=+